MLGGVSLGRLYPDRADLANGLVVAVTETSRGGYRGLRRSALKEVLA